MRGFTFLELLIALTIFSAGLLGILQLQFLAQRQIHEAVYISRASIQAYNLSALFIMFDTTPHSVVGLTLQDDWNEYNAHILPQSKGEVTSQAIIVDWHNPLYVEKSQVKLQHGFY